MPLNYATVTGTFDDGQGQPVTGSATFTPSATLYASGVPVVTPDSPVQAQILSGQLLSAAGGPLQLLATDNAGITIEGQTAFWFWTVKIQIGGSGADPWSFFLPHTPSPVDLFSLSGGAGGGGFANPMTTLGDMMYENATPAAARLAGNTTAASEFLNSTGSGSAATAPAWKAIAASDLAAVPSNPGPGNPLALTPAGLMTWSPYPWKFHIASYGAKGDGRLVTDAVMNNASATLTSATAAFVAGDAGKRVMVYGAAGGAGTWLAAAITTVNSSTSVTLSAAATSSITSAVCLIATDDSAAVKAQLAASLAYWQAHSGATEHTIDPLIYGMAVAPAVGGATLGNAQIPWPLVPSTGGKFQPQYVSSQDVTPLIDFQQTIPETAGAFFACMSAAGTNDGTFGPSYMFGGPVQGYGGEPGLFNNVYPTVRGVGLLEPWNTSIGGWDLFSCAGYDFENWAVMPLGVVTGAAVPLITSPGNMTNTWFIAGVRTACAGNNDRCHLGHGSVEGMCYGIGLSEHAVLDDFAAIYCINGIEVYSGPSNMVNSARVNYASVEACINGIGVFDSGKLDVAVMSVENLTAIIRDINAGSTPNVLNGSVGLRGDIGSGYTSSGVLSGGTGGANLRITNLNNPPGPVSSPQAPPASGSAWVNGYYQTAEITLSIAGGTLSALLTDAVAEFLPASCTLYKFAVPPGHTYTPTFTGTLTHKVKLL